MEAQEIAKTMLSAFDFVLIERMNAPLKEYIIDSLLNSVSNIIRIVTKGKTISINRDEYVYDDIFRFILSNLGDDTSVIIDGYDILTFD